MELELVLDLEQVWCTEACNLCTIGHHSQRTEQHWLRNKRLCHHSIHHPRSNMDQMVQGLEKVKGLDLDLEKVQGLGHLLWNQSDQT